MKKKNTLAKLVVLHNTDNIFLLVTT